MSTTQEAPTGSPLPGERNVSDVAGRRGASFTGGRAAAVIATGAVVLVVLVFTRHPQKGHTGQQPDYQVQQHVAFEPAPLPPLPVAMSEPAPVLNSAPAQLAQLPQQTNQGPSPLDKARMAPVMQFAGDVAVKPGGQAGGAEGELPTDNSNALAASLVATKMIGSKASVLPHRNMLVTMGTVIPCVLETALDSTLPGFATCMVPRDVLSDDSTVVLMEKGTKIVGEFKGGVRQGQHRVFILWTRAETPNGVIVSLGSPATDAVGRSGVDGVYDGHFWETVRRGADVLAGGRCRQRGRRIPRRQQWRQWQHQFVVLPAERQRRAAGRGHRAGKQHQHPADDPEEPRRIRQYLRRPAIWISAASMI